MPIEIRVARTQDERETVYRLRYTVYVEKMRRPCHADHKKMRLTDVLDEKARILYACDNRTGKFVGTVRTNLGKDSPLEFVDEYEMKQFDQAFPKHVSTTSKLIVLPEYRKSIFPGRMYLSLYEYGLENGIKYDFINVNTNVPLLVKFYEKLGYRRYKESFIHPEFGQVLPMVLPLHEFKLSGKLQWHR